MLVADDLLLLLTDPTGEPSPLVVGGIGAALLVDLAEVGRITVGRRDGYATVGPRDADDRTPTGVPALDAAVAEVARRPDEHAVSLIGRLGRAAIGLQYESLVDAGLVTRAERRGRLRTRAVFPETDGAARTRLTARLHGVLHDEDVPTVRTLTQCLVLWRLRRLDVLGAGHDERVVERRLEQLTSRPVADATPDVMPAVHAAATSVLLAGASGGWI